MGTDGHTYLQVGRDNTKIQGHELHELHEKQPNNTNSPPAPGYRQAGLKGRIICIHTWSVKIIGLLFVSICENLCTIIGCFVFIRVIRVIRVPVFIYLLIGHWHLASSR